MPPASSSGICSVSRSSGSGSYSTTPPLHLDATRPRNGSALGFAGLVDLLDDRHRRLVALGQTGLQQLQPLGGQLHAVALGLRLDVRQEGVVVRVRAGPRLAARRSTRFGQRLFVRPRRRPAGSARVRVRPRSTRSRSGRSTVTFQ